MNKLISILALVILSVTLSHGQVSNTITVKKELGRYQFTQFGKQLSGTALANAVKPNEDAYRDIKISQSNHILATIIGLTGGIIIISKIDYTEFCKMKWESIGFGACLVVVSIPLDRLSKKQTLKAVNTFNTGLQTGFTQYKTDLQVKFTGNGVGLQYNF